MATTENGALFAPQQQGFVSSRRATSPSTAAEAARRCQTQPESVVITSPHSPSSARKGFRRRLRSLSDVISPLKGRKQRVFAGEPVLLRQNSTYYGFCPARARSLGQICKEYTSTLVQRKVQWSSLSACS